MHRRYWTDPAGGSQGCVDPGGAAWSPWPDDPLGFASGSHSPSNLRALQRQLPTAGPRLADAERGSAAPPPGSFVRKGVVLHRVAAGCGLTLTSCVLRRFHPGLPGGSEVSTSLSD